MNEEPDIDEIMIATAGRATLIIEQFSPGIDLGETCNILYAAFCGEWDDEPLQDIFDAIIETKTAPRAMPN